jgi:hypothetical protein
MQVSQVVEVISNRDRSAIDLLEFGNVGLAYDNVSVG